MKSITQPNRSSQVSRFMPLALFYAAVTLFLFSTPAFAQAGSTELGQWTTIDDQSGEPKSIVQLYKKGDKLFGRVVKLHSLPANSVCKQCKGALKDKPIVGMNIIQNMSYNAETKRWYGGIIIDPKTGKQYECLIWMHNGALNVRGYMGPFFRTQVWKRP